MRAVAEEHRRDEAEAADSATHVDARAVALQLLRPRDGADSGREALEDRLARLVVRDTMDALLEALDGVRADEGGAGDHDVCRRCGKSRVSRLHVSGSIFRSIAKLPDDSPFAPRRAPRRWPSRGIPISVIRSYAGW